MGRERTDSCVTGDTTILWTEYQKQGGKGPQTSDPPPPSALAPPTPHLSFGPRSAILGAGQSYQQRGSQHSANGSFNNIDHDNRVYHENAAHEYGPSPQMPSVHTTLPPPPPPPALVNPPNGKTYEEPLDSST